MQSRMRECVMELKIKNKIVGHNFHRTWNWVKVF